MKSRKMLFLAGCVVFGLLPLFLNAYRYDLPVGYAGMFASFGEQLAAENFRLPLEALGGVPYVYPPLGFYLHAAFFKLGISTWFYMRWVVPFFSVAALVVFALVYERLFQSKVWAALAAVLLAAAPYLVESNAWAAGTVRGLAFLTFSLAFFIVLKLETTSNWMWAALAGFLSGLTILSHLGYAFFLSLWMGIWFLFHLKLWKQALVVGLVALATVAPWLGVVLARYPASIFLNAMQAHGTTSIVTAVQDPSQFAGLVFLGLSKLFEIPLLGWLSLFGAGVQLARRRYEVPVMLAITLLFSLESRRFVIVLGIFLTIGLFQAVTAALAQKKILFAVGITLSILIILVIYVAELERVVMMKPSLTRNLIAAGEFLRDNSDPSAEYVMVADYGETEWFPFLSQRVPAFAHWAREWQGDLEGQGMLSWDANVCAALADLDCLDQVILRSKTDPDYLVVMKTEYRELVEVISVSPEWRRVYNNPEFQVYKSRKR